MTRLMRVLSSTETRWMIAIVTVALVLRIAWVGGVHPSPRDGRFDDSVFYDSAARHMAAGEGYVFDPTVWKVADGGSIYPDEHDLTATALWPPGYPATLAAIYKLTGNSQWAARLLNLMLGSLTPLLVYLVARRLFGPAPAVFSGMALAILPGHIFFTAVLLSETEFGFLLALTLVIAVYFVFGREKPNLPAIAGLGVLVAFTGLVRGEMTAFGAVIALFLLLQYRRRALLPIAALALGAAAIITPWTVRNWVQMGEPIAGSTGAGGVAYQAHNPDTNGGPSLSARTQLEQRFQGVSRTEQEVELNRAGTRDARTWAWDHKRRELQLVPKRLYLLFKSDEGGIAWIQSNKAWFRVATADRLIRLSSFTFFGLMAFALASIMFWRKRRDLGVWLVFSVIPFYMLIFGVLFVGDPRYHYALYIPLTIFAGVALAQLREMTAEHYREATGGRTIAAAWRDPA